MNETERMNKLGPKAMLCLRQGATLLEDVPFMSSRPLYARNTKVARVSSRPDSCVLCPHSWGRLYSLTTASSSAYAMPEKACFARTTAAIQGSCASPREAS